MNRKTSNILKKALAGSLAVTMALSFGGCGNSEKEDAKGKIAVICKAQGVSFWDDVKMGAEDAAEELGYEIVYSCAAKEANIDEQIGYINQAIEQQVKAIVIAPNSSTELNTKLKEAASKGIKIITVNSDVTGLDERLCCISSDNISCGNIAARQIATILNNKKTAQDASGTGDAFTGAIGVIGHGANSSTSNERIQGFNQELVEFLFRSWRDTAASGDEQIYELASDELKAAYDAGSGLEMYDSDPTAFAKISQELYDFSHIKVLDAVSCENDRNTAKQQAAEMIRKNSDLKVIYGTNTNSTLGICDAVSEAGKNGEILVVVYNSDKAEIEYLKNSVLSGLVVQSPYNMGYLGVRYANKALDGDKLPLMIDTGATYVTLANIESTDVQLLLDPRKEL